MFPILGTQHQQRFPFQCSRGFGRSDIGQFHSGSGAGRQLCPQGVPCQDSSVSGLFILQLPVLPQHQELQLPDVPDCVSRHRGYCMFLPVAGVKATHFSGCCEIEIERLPLYVQCPGTRQPNGIHGQRETAGSFYTFHESLSFQK